MLLVDNTMLISVYVQSVGPFVKFTDFGYFLFLLEQHLLVLPHEVLLALELLVVIRLAAVYFLIYLYRARSLEEVVPHTVKILVPHRILGRNAEIRIELQHVRQQLHCQRIGFLEQSRQFVLVLVSCDHV